MDTATVRRAVGAITPPLVQRAVRWMVQRSPPEYEPEYEYIPEGFTRRVRGWNAEEILEANSSKWPAFVGALTGTGPLAVNHEASVSAIETADDPYAHNLLVSFAYVLALAARKRDQISLLDWGGGIGHYYLIAKAVLPEVEIDYHCRDLPPFCAHGRQLFPGVSFYEDDSCLDRRYNIVLASGSLQYSERWRETLTGLASATEDYLYVTRAKAALSGPSFVVVQRAHRYGYDTEFLGWVINRDELLDTAAAAGLMLRREFRLAAGFSAVGAPKNPIHERGFLFSARSGPRVRPKTGT